MTRRERKERRAESRREWAEGREQKAVALERQNEPFRGDYAFNTQPGHIPERARANRRSEKAFEHQKMAAHHRERAAGIEDQLDRTVFADDEDAVERLEARIAEREAEREKRKAANAAWRKAGKPGLNGTDEDRAGWERVAAAIGAAWAANARRGLMHQGRSDSGTWVPYSWAKPFDLTNLGASIRRDQARLEEARIRASEKNPEKDLTPAAK